MTYYCHCHAIIHVTCNINKITDKISKDYFDSFFSLRYLMVGFIGRLVY
jgi:hypothetical protein